MKFVEVIGKFVCAVAVGCGGWLRFHKFVKVDVKATQAIGNVNLGAKMKVVPSSTIAVELMIAIKFTKGLSVSSPTWRANCWYFTSKPT